MAKSTKKEHLKRRFFRVLWPFIFFLFALYIAKQSLFGDRGFFTWRTLKEQVYLLEKENKTLSHTLNLLEKEADRLAGDDPDAIDMAIRQNLPMLRADEYLIMEKSPQ